LSYGDPSLDNGPYRNINPERVKSRLKNGERNRCAAIRGGTYLVESKAGLF